jgi:hypothetical protein
LRTSHVSLLQKIKKEGKLDPVDEQNLNNILEAFIPDSGLAMKS